MSKLATVSATVPPQGVNMHVPVDTLYVNVCDHVCR